MGKINDIETMHLIGEGIAHGKSASEIAKELMVVPSTVTRQLKKKEQRDIVKHEMSKIVNALPSIIEKQLNESKLSILMTKALTDPDFINDTKMESFDEIMSFLRYVQSNERELLKSMGVLPTQTTNQYIQQIYNDNRNSIIDDKVLKYLGLKNQEENDIDETVIEISDEDITIIDDE